MVEVADKLADFVAKNGRHYEDMTRERNPGNTPFKFLWDKTCKEYKYYEVKLNSLMRASSGAQAGAIKKDKGATSQDIHSRSNSGNSSKRHHPPTSMSAGNSRVADFIPSARFTGAKPSMVFKQGPHGLGYYQDIMAAAAASQQQSAVSPLPPPASAASKPQQSWQQQQEQQHHSTSQYSPTATENSKFSARKRNRWELSGPAAASSDPYAAAAASIADPMNSSISGNDAPSSSKAGTLSAMEEYMQRLEAAAAQKRREEEEEEEERRRRAAAPLLKETAFDRRKVVAVYKDDGRRGHHMDDFIPKEELAKFMAQTGNKQLAQQVEAQSAIGADNIGHKLLQKMGWKEGQGIGAKEDGRTAPVAAAGAAAAAGMKQDTLGLGAQAHGAVEESDDPFEQYRKRMMLGYKFRPNPLGNPRRPYY
eukprot:GHRR01010328.1.p1 GENE.GHRR01010328.1~~GHRR01010328.1.p1  ORF type:complete len:422 (+),score=187.27 GHRR01010328.1:388-1653(+)